MQRKATQTTRAANAAERKHIAWCKDQNCAVCGRAGPSICDHVFGATFKHAKTLIGMWCILPLCVECDRIKTLGSLRKFTEKFGRVCPMILSVINRSPAHAPSDVLMAIEDWGR